MSHLQIPGFELIEKVGQGGMASVWKARQVSLDRVVAIKFLSSRLSSDPSDIQRFQAEAQSAAKLKHPGIVQVYDANFVSGVYYYVMEFVAGYTVSEWLRRKGRLPEEEALQVTDCIADALGYAWEREHIIHCDIKPDNVMVDADGTVKVTDLGLARTISTMASDEVIEEILGTPAYMSPEQAMGESVLDCRADMYSLGATLYHMVTGKLLFHGLPDQEVMEKQVTDSVRNPRDDYNVSKHLASFIEVLLAKDRNARYTSWDDIRKDIARVRRNLPPRVRLSSGAVSTLAKSEKVQQEIQYQKSSIAARLSDETNAKTKWIRLAIAGILTFVLFTAGYFLVGTLSHQGKHGPLEEDVKSRSGDRIEVNVQEDMLKEAFKWDRQNPGKRAEAIARFRAVVDKAPSTSIAEAAQREITRREAELHVIAIKQAMVDIKRVADPMIEEGRLAEAIAVIEGYKGDHAEETADERTKWAVELRETHRVAEEERQKQETLLARRKTASLSAAVAKALLSSGESAARDLIETALTEGGLGIFENSFREASKVLLDALNIDEDISASYRDDVGMDITVQLVGGSKRLTITRVESGTVFGEQRLTVGSATASTDVRFSIADLALTERLNRMGSDDNQHVALIKGLIAYKSKSFSHAKNYFEKTHSLLSSALLEAIGDTGVKQKEQDALSELQRLLLSIGIRTGDFDAQVWADLVRQVKLPLDAARRMQSEVEGYKVRHSETKFVTEAAPVLEALVQSGTQPTAQQSVIPPPPDDAVDPVGFLDEFIRKNPMVQSDSIRTEKDEKGRITAIIVESPAFADLTALPSLPALRSIQMINPQQPLAPLSDISCLRGVQIHTLVLVNARVSNVSPLRGMPLVSLNLSGSEVRDIGPLRGMSLSTLDISRTKVYDFSPLSGMPLKQLYINETQCKNIAFMRGMQLEVLEATGTGMYDFSFLSRFPLRELNLSSTQLSSLEYIKDLSLKRLEIEDTKVVDISYLRNMMELTHVNFAGTRIKDFDVLRGKALSVVDIRKTSFSDIGILSLMPLRHLNASGSALKDLTGINAEHLRYLGVENTSISDLSPVVGAPLRYLLVRNSAVRDFGVLAGSSIQYLTISNPEHHAEFLSTLPRLRSINGERILPVKAQK